MSQPVLYCRCSRSPGSAWPSPGRWADALRSRHGRRRPGTQVSVGAQVLHGHLEFETDGASNVAGADAGNAMEWAPGGSLFVSRELGGGWSIGFASYGDFGLSLNYENGQKRSSGVYKIRGDSLFNAA